MSVRLAVALSLLISCIAPAASLAAGGQAVSSQTSVLTLIQIAAALIILAVILAAARHARSRTASREQVWLPPSWTDEGDLR